MKHRFQTEVNSEFSFRIGEERKHGAFRAARGGADRQAARRQHRGVAGCEAGRGGRCRRRARRTALAAAHGAEARSADDIIAAKDIDAILIGTSTDTHADFIEQAVRGGQGGALREAGRPRREADRGLPEGGRARRQAADDRLQPPLRSEFRRRSSSGSTPARSATVEMVTIISRDPGPPPISYIERSGGLYRDMMIHDFDMARFLLGEEPVEVHAVGSVLVDPGDRQGRRRRHRDGDDAHRLRQALPDLLLAPRHLRLRPAHRGPRLGAA